MWKLTVDFCDNLIDKHFLLFFNWQNINLVWRWVWKWRLKSIGHMLKVVGCLALVQVKPPFWNSVTWSRHKNRVMASTMVDPSLYGSPVTSVGTGFQTNVPDKSRLSHNGDDPGGGGGGIMEDGNDTNSNSIPSKDAMRQSLKEVIR